MNIEFTSYAVREYEKKKSGNSLYKLFIVQTNEIVELLKIATNSHDERAVCAYLDVLKKEKDGLRGVLFFLLDELEADGFLPYMTAFDIKEAIDSQGEDMKKKLTQTEGELLDGLKESFMKMLTTVEKTKTENGALDGVNLKSKPDLED